MLLRYVIPEQWALSCAVPIAASACQLDVNREMPFADRHDASQVDQESVMQYMTGPKNNEMLQKPARDLMVSQVLDR